MTESKLLADYPVVADLAFAYGGPCKGTAVFKQQPEDFFVEEVLGFELTGEGEHLWLFIEAVDMNTEFTLKQLARAFGIEKKQISYSGKKDRRAVTRQWFSLHLPGQHPDMPESIHQNIKVLSAQRHHKKLRRGAHRENQFKIRLRNPEFIEQDHFSQIIHQIKRQGYPNYFGPQRFGHNENNIGIACEAMKTRKRLKRMERDRIFSTLRAWDFNRFLSLRVADNSWCRYLDGDLLQLSGSNSFFQPETWDDETQQRLASGDIQIAGVLPGKGDKQTPLKDANYQADASLVAYLIAQRVEQGVRPLAVIPRDLTCQFGATEDDRSIILSFYLPKGAYATSLLRELVNLQE